MKVSALRALFALSLFTHALACGDSDPLPTADGGRVDAGRADGSAPNPQLVFTPDPTSLAIVEGAGPISFVITLSEDPKATFNASLVVADPSALSVSPTSGTFDSSNFSTGITVTLTPEDDDDTVNDTTTITVTADSGSQTFAVTVVDDDAANIVVVPTAVSMAEGTTSELRVRLSASPDQSVTVNVRSTDEARLTGSASALTFSSAEWNVDQVVTLTALEDEDLAANTVSVVLDQASGNTATVAVSISDNDTQAFIVSTSSITVGEGATETFTVRLAYEPAADVTVAVTSASDLVATALPASLTFTPGNYAEAQTVTVSGTQDIDLVGASTVVSLSSADVPTAASVSVTVVDDDSQQILVSTSSVTVDENGTAFIGVRLAYEPESDVTVFLAISDATHVGASEVELTFTTATYDQEQTIVLSGLDDADVRDEFESLTFSAAGANDVIASVTVIDDDTQAIITDLGSVAVAEGGVAAIGVRLAFEPDADTVVSAASLLGAFGVAPGSLTFTPGNYDQFQNLALSGLQDDDVANELDSLELTATNVATTSIPVTVTDEDVQAILASTTGISVSENGTATFTGRLAFRPGADVTVDVTPADGFLGAAPASLVFDDASWNVPQTVTVSAADDENVEDEQSSVSLTSAGLATVTVDVNVIDSDVLNLVVTPDNLTLTEGGQAGTFDVRITQEPSAPTTVTITPSGPGVVNLSATTLVFDAGNWTQAQTITVNPADDDDALNETVTLTVSTPGLTPRTVTVFVTDDDVQAILLSANTLNLTEGTDGSITVTLQANPVDPATVTIVIDDDTAVGASTATLVFNATNWGDPQTVVVSALGDADTRNEVATLTFASAVAPSQVLTVNVTDPDQQSLVLTTNVVALGEGDNQLVGVRLAFDPVDPVTVTVLSSDANAVGAAPATLVFNSGNYQDVQNVTVSAPQDNDTVDETETVTLTSPVTAAEVIDVTVTDDDTQAIVTSVGVLNLNEGAGGNFTVQLAFNPLGAVTVNVATSDGNVADPTPIVLNFDQNNWNIPVPVAVAAPQDDDTQDNNATITLSSAVTVDAQVDVNVTDDDDQAILVSVTDLTVAEGGTNSFTVSLAFNPLGPVTVTLDNPDAGAVGVVPLTLNFNAGNYTIAQTVTVNAPQDDDALEENVTITLSGAGAAQNETVDVTVNDDDTQAIQVSVTDLTVTEGDQGNFTVRLAFNPINPATVTITSDDEGAALPVPISLNFDAGNYTVPQTVVINGMADPDLADENVTITLSSPIAPDAQVDVTVEDDDTQSLIVTPLAVAPGEGGTDTFSVRLAFIPPANQVVGVLSNDEAVATVSDATLTFTPGAYDQPQIITVFGTEDQNLVEDNTTITLSSAGVPNVDVDVSVADNDTQAYVIVPLVLNLDEGDSAQFGVALEFEPPAPVTVNVLSSDDAAASVSDALLVFDAGNYTVAQPITVTAEQDNDTRDENETITMSSADVPVDGTVDVLIDDDDVQALVVVPTDLTIDEDGEGGGTFSVRFAFEPDADTDVTITSTDPGAVDVFPLTLTFTPGNYDQPQDVAVDAVTDDDLADELVDVEVTTAIAPMELVTVTVLDDDTQAIVASTANITVTEETGPDTFTVRLAFRPAAQTTVTIVSSNDLAATAAPATLVFEVDEFDVEQTVTVSGTSDTDQVDTTATLTLSSAGVADEFVDVNVIDDDEQFIIVSTNTVNVDEEDTTTFTVRLAFEPLALTESITLLSDDLNAASVDPTVLVFDAASYDQPQTVTVSGEEDADIRDETVNVSLTSNDILTPAEAVTINVNDIDIMTIQLSSGALDLIEGGQPGPITAWLSNEPTGNLVVSVTSLDLGAVTRNPVQLTFDDTNYGDPQTVTLSPVDDNDVRDETVDVEFTAPAVATETLVVSVQDDDTQSIIIDSEGLTVDEGGTSPFTVRLEFEPTDPVTVTVTPNDPAFIGVDPVTLVFTAGNYTIEQTVTVSGLQDDDLDDEVTSITLSTGALAAPEGAADLTLDVDVIDDDEQVILVESVPVTLPTSVQEGGPGVAFRVRLQYPPRLSEGGTDTVDVSSVAGNLSFAPNSFTFDQADFADWVTVVITATDDGDELTDLVDVDLAIAGEVATTHAVQVIDDEITVLTSLDVPELTGGTLFTRRQNIGWGSTRLGITGFDAVSGQTRIASNTRELDDSVIGPAVGTGAGPFRTEAVEFDGTSFGFFSTNGGGFQYVQSDETANAVALSVPVTAANTLNFWPTWNGVDRFGVVYRLDGATSDNLLFRVVQTDGTVTLPSTLTVAQGADDEAPNVHWNGTGFTVLYSNGTEVRCLRTNANGALIAGSDTVLTNFPAGGVTLSSVFDGTSIVGAYYDATNSINLVRINPADCTVTGAHEVIGGANVFFSAPPSIGYNGTEFAVAYDYLDGLDERTGVLLVTPALEFRDDYVLPDVGRRPSITWAGDRWAVRYNDATQVKVLVGSFQTHCADGIQNVDETDVDCGGNDCRACPD